MSKLLLLDSNSLINRAFYALPPMNAPDGTPTNAVYGYLSMLSNLIKQEEPTHICAVFDVKAPTFRHKMDADYKATRKPMPDDLRPQIPLLQQILGVMGIKVATLAGYEADDIIGTLAKRHTTPTIIVSGDRDVLQLIDDTTTVFNTKRGVTDIKVYDAVALAEEGFTPAQIIEYKGLAGDTSDNIPGCPGVGEKTAMGLISDFKSIDGVYQHIDEVKGKLKEKLLENKNSVYKSKVLATICTEVPIECGLPDMAFSAEIPEAFFARLHELGIRKLDDRFRHKGGGEIVEQPKEEIKAVSAINPKVVYVDNLPELTKLLSSVKTISVTFGECVTFAFDTKTEYKVKCSQSLFDMGIGFDEAVDALRLSLQNPKNHKLIFDVKGAMYANKISILPPYDDVMLMAYVADATSVPRSVNALLEAENLSTETPACGLIEASSRLSEKLKKLELGLLYSQLELPLVDILYNMESAGFRVNSGTLAELGTRFHKELEELTVKIKEAVGGIEFNINSPQQLAEVLFDKLGLGHGKKGKSGHYSVAQEVLEELEHPAIDLILRYRTIAKLTSTYIDGMRALIGSDGKIHTQFRQALTLTGRLSSVEPNLQNIPVRDDEGKEIRKAFIASDGCVLVSADYSQIELRLLAHFSRDPVLMDAYKRGLDIHAITASSVLNKPLSEVTSADRRTAKAVNFGIIYGISAFGLAKNIGTTSARAKHFIEKYFATYPAVKAYMEGNADYAEKYGFVRTMLGRMRRFPELKSANANIRSFGRRAAMNMPLQGSAADIIKRAMILVHNAICDGGYKAKLILQVHDELIIDCPKSEAEAVKRLLKEKMEVAVKLNVPLIADCEEGENWFLC